MNDPRIHLPNAGPGFYESQVAAIASEFDALSKERRRELRKFIFPEAERKPERFGDLPDWKQAALRGRFEAD